MDFEITYDEHGKPMNVSIHHGYVSQHRQYCQATDGWMLTQLDPRDFPVIEAGRQLEALVQSHNHLSRRNWEMEQQLTGRRMFA